MRRFLHLDGLIEVVALWNPKKATALSPPEEILLLKANRNPCLFVSFECDRIRI